MYAVPKQVCVSPPTMFLENAGRLHCRAKSNLVFGSDPSAPTTGIMRASIIIASALSVAQAAPCDIYQTAGTPCVAAHSLTRALFSAYNGPLYSVNRTDGSTMDIGLLAPGGVVNAKAQDSFCAGSSCIVSTIYDQSSRANHLTISPPGGAWRHPGLPVNATRYPTKIAGAAAYAAYFETKMGYRIDKTSGVATGNEEETLYMITSAENVNGGCCFGAFSAARMSAQCCASSASIRFAPPPP